MRSLSQLSELGSICVIKGDIEATVRIRHHARVHESARYVHVFVKSPAAVSGHPRRHVNWSDGLVLGALAPVSRSPGFPRRLRAEGNQPDRAGAKAMPRGRVVEMMWRPLHITFAGGVRS